MPALSALLSGVDRAVELFNEATRLYEEVKPSLDNITGPGSTDAKAAAERLDAAMSRARAAHSSLDEAISKRLGE